MDMDETATPTYIVCRQRRRLDEVYQVEIADELQIDRAGVSRFERYGNPLPRPFTPVDYMAALRLIVARREEEATG